MSVEYSRLNPRLYSRQMPDFTLHISNALLSSVSGQPFTVFLCSNSELTQHTFKIKYIVVIVLYLCQAAFSRIGTTK